MALWDTAANIIGDAAVELKLVSFQAKPADPFASTDPNLGQLCQLLKSVGRDLAKKREWTHLRAIATLTTVQGQSKYDLPADFGRMINQTGWNRTNRLPLGGPLSPQEWEYLEGQLAGIVFTVLFRPMQGQLWLYPDTNTPGGQSLAYEYVSKNWVQQSGQTAPNTDVPGASSDTVWFDPQLVMRGLKLAFLRANGLDSTAAEQDYEDALEQAFAEDTPGRVLNLAKTATLQQPLLGQQNIPLTGFGN
jgi:hypothetical protein